MLYTAGVWEGAEVSVTIFAFDSGGVSNLSPNLAFRWSLCARTQPPPPPRITLPSIADKSRTPFIRLKRRQKRYLRNVH